MGPEQKLRTWIVIGKFSQVKVLVNIPKALFLLYCAKAPLIQLTRSGPLRAWPKIEGFSGVVVENTS